MKVARILLSLVIPASVTMMSGCANPFKDLLGSPTAPSNNTPSTDTFNGSLAPSARSSSRFQWRQRATSLLR